MLAVEAAIGPVGIERGAVDHPRPIEKAFGAVGRIEAEPHPIGGVDYPAGDDPAQGIHGEVDAGSGEIARIARTQERNVEIGSARHAPGGEGQAEIRRLRGNARLFCQIDQPAEAEAAVDDEAEQGVAGAAGLALEQVVGEVDRAQKIGEPVMDAVANRFRHALPVGIAERAEDEAIDLATDGEEGPVRRFQGIVVELELRGRSGIVGRRRRGAGAERQQKGTAQEVTDAVDAPGASR